VAQEGHVPLALVTQGEVAAPQLAHVQRRQKLIDEVGGANLAHLIVEGVGDDQVNALSGQ